MKDANVRRLLIATDDNFLADTLARYMRLDGIEIERVDTGEDAAHRIAQGADGVLVDLAKRGMSGDAIMMISWRAQRWDVPLLVLSSQPRRDLTDFSAVVRATEVLSKTEPMTAIAARIRMCMRTPFVMDSRKKSGFPAGNLDWALAGAPGQPAVPMTNERSSSVSTMEVMAT